MSVVKYFAADFVNRRAWVVAFRAKKRSSRFTRVHLNWNSLEVLLITKGNNGHSSVGRAETPAIGRDKQFPFNLKEQFLDYLRSIRNGIRAEHVAAIWEVYGNDRLEGY